MLYGFSDKKFETGASDSAVTTEPLSVQEISLITNQPLRIVDTPGFNDRHSSDESLVKPIVESIREAVPFVHIFMIVINS